MTLEQEVKRLAKGKTFITIRYIARELEITGQKAARILKALGFRRWSSGHSTRPVWYKPEEYHPS